MVQKILLDRRQRKHSLLLIVNALLYVLKTGCQLRMLPPYFRKWQLVYYYLRKWKGDFTILLLHDKLVDWVMIKTGKRIEPLVTIMDSQSVKTTCVAGVQRGFDAYKRIKSRKRHILTDTFRLLNCVVVNSASTPV